MDEVVRPPEETGARKLAAGAVPPAPAADGSTAVKRHGARVECSAERGMMSH